ncbi:MAG: DUF1847 domain-containing protein [Clostridiales bacterium]|nr:DUF1847 domain-containing protein [Clostridiales bacterium]
MSTENRTDNICRSCIDCAAGACDGKHGIFPSFCLTADMKDGGERAVLCDESLDKYLNDPEDRLIAKASATVEFENYCKMTRVEEICEFAAQIGATKLGIATCVGLLREARTAAEIFRHKGFEVYGVACKVGAVRKTDIGLNPEQESLGPHICNPILQAKILNEKKTDLNIVIGLCVGHDSLFYKYSDALCTTLVTKDRVLGHNPAAALYQADGYYSKLLK